MARPEVWTEEKKLNAIELIFDEMANGKSIRAILDNADRKLLPSNKTFLEWLNEDEALSKQYARAIEIRADYHFEEIIKIADNVENDLIKLEDGREVVNHALINRDRLRVDARKWIVSKMNPKKYGEKIEQNVNLNTEQPIFKGIDLNVRENNSST